MELFIRIKDGQPFEHPIFGNNFRQAFPNVDIENLPPEFARFIRVPVPEIGPYEIYEGVIYVLADGVCKDVHQVSQMTVEQIAEKQNSIKNTWNASGLFSWIFNENTCSFSPPIPYPEDGNHYRWDEPTTSWVEVTNA